RSKPLQTRDARWAPIQTIRQTVAGRTLLRLDPVAAPHTCALGVLPPKLPRLRPARLPRHPLQAILRYVLIARDKSGRAEIDAVPIAKSASAFFGAKARGDRNNHAGEAKGAPLLARPSRGAASDARSHDTRTRELRSRPF